MPSPDRATTAGTMDHILPVLKAHAPPGASVSLTGYEQLSAGSTAKGGGGPRVLVETLIGALRPLLVLPFVFASEGAPLPFRVAARTILPRVRLASVSAHL